MTDYVSVRTLVCMSACNYQSFVDSSGNGDDVENEEYNLEGQCTSNDGEVDYLDVAAFFYVDASMS